MIVEKAARQAGVEIVGEKLPLGQRTVKVFQRLIAAVRAAEGEVYDRLKQVEEDLNNTLKEKLGLLEENQSLRAQLAKQRFNEAASLMPALSVADRNKLLATIEVKDDTNGAKDGK